LKAIYAGSFDPFTNGHLHVVREACSLFDELYVVMAVNPDKKRRTSQFDMVTAMSSTFRDNNIHNATIIQTVGLIADFARDYKVDYLIRGLRNVTDYDYEENMARINEVLGIKTIYIRAGEMGYISSSMVMELNKYRRDISQYVPAPVINLLREG
jgi:pantetheine-phosphate adenylyltransferase